MNLLDLVRVIHPKVRAYKGSIGWTGYIVSAYELYPGVLRVHARRSCSMDRRRWLETHTGVRITCLPSELTPRLLEPIRSMRPAYIVTPAAHAAMRVLEWAGPKGVWRKRMGDPADGPINGHDAQCRLDNPIPRC